MNAKYCKSCGKLINSEKGYCKDCLTELGEVKNFSEVVEIVSKRMKKNSKFSDNELKKMVEQNLNSLPKWIDKKGTGKEKRFMLIIDVGSTTTKAILFEIRKGKYRKIALENSQTTVEKPNEDVNIGVLNVIKKIEKKYDVELLKTHSEKKYELHDDIGFISTSSAGGGLQILVVGLTMFDTASSAKRAAFGSGGVLLDTFAIDDKRSALEQMQSMKVLHPDIILFSGGFEKGAISGVVRLAEILSIANPESKFEKDKKIPLVFAGNSLAVPFIRNNFSKMFDLYIVPNIRPSIEEENLVPAQRMIHKLFMGNVMEQAPGYTSLKKIVDDDIIPTPSGVIKSLKILGKDLDNNIISCDIGGATTDIYSNILGEYYRTVSGNLGMSYSISNVLKEGGIQGILDFLPDYFPENYVRNYISNKMLFPTDNPTKKSDKIIEYAVAKQALQISLAQHIKMNFNTKKIGYLEKLHRKYAGTFTTEKFIVTSNGEEFPFDKINLMIGAGGIFSHSTDKDSLFILNDGLQPKGVTEMWKDEFFISPHLGKLSEIDEENAKKFLKNKTYKKIGLVISLVRKIKKKDKIKVEISRNNTNEILELSSEMLHYVENKEKDELSIRFLKNGKYFDCSDENLIKSSDNLLFDTRSDKIFNDLYVDNKDKISFEENFNKYKSEFIKEVVNEKMRVTLPYKGKILKAENEEVEPETIVGINEHQPPKIYIVPILKDQEQDLSDFQEYLKVKENDIVKVGQVLLDIPSKKLDASVHKKETHLNENIVEKLMDHKLKSFSPVRGRITKIDLESKQIIIKEVQDYSTKPVKIKVADKLFVEPNQIAKYMRKELNSFVYKGEILASQILGVSKFQESMSRLITGGDNSNSIIITSPTTGYLREINLEKGYIVIKYDFKRLETISNVYGKIVKTQNKEIVDIEYSGLEMNGMIGFGLSSGGDLKIQESLVDNPNLKGKIVLFNGSPSLEELEICVRNKIAGLIIPSIENKVIVEFIKNEIGIGLTGEEKIDFPIILLNSFGKSRIEKKLMETFVKKENYHTYINGKTQIRSGVVRPKIVIQEK